MRIFWLTGRAPSASTAVMSTASSTSLSNTEGGSTALSGGSRPYRYSAWRAESSVQQQVAVVEAPRPVATARMPADQIEARRRRAPRKAPSSRPSRQTTRNGRLRIGTMVQKVTAPVRKPEAPPPCCNAALSCWCTSSSSMGRVSRRPGPDRAGGAGLGEQQQRLAGLALVEQRIDQHLQVIRPLGQRARPSQLIGLPSRSTPTNRPSNCPRAFQRPAASAR